MILVSGSTVIHRTSELFSCEIVKIVSYARKNRLSIDNIENKVEEEPPECDYVEPTIEHPNFTGETLYNVFMRSMGNYTESEN